MELENETEQANNAKSRLETEVGQLQQEINNMRYAHALADSEEATCLRAIDKDHQLCPTKLQAAFNQWAQSEAARQSAVTAHADCVDAKEAARLSRVDEEHQSCAARLHAVSEDLMESEAARTAAVAAHADCAKECKDCQELAVALESLEREVKEIDRSLQ
ncbi:uncharacterized protein RHO25_002999 [Cercospora beticola]|uniref:Uncharacterized protein n=1 Tax=Cercospora beticola TaxID=122368 RepID=A0ABZ0NFT3_CERBT|nr:hypothetical protein RHO25_002999 [Cercospora beticola]